MLADNGFVYINPSFLNYDSTQLLWDVLYYTVIFPSTVGPLKPLHAINLFC